MNGFTLLNPVGLAALASLAVVGVIYFFYKRHRHRVVSGLFLFESRDIRQRSGRKLARPRTSRSLVLDILACLLLSLAVAEPTFFSAFGSHLVIILDGSLSMRAQNNHLKVREQALALLSKHGGGETTIIEAGRTPKVAVAAKAASEAYRRAVREYDPFASRDSLSAALSLVRASITGSVVVHLFTDHRPTSLKLPGGQVVMHTVKAAGPNLALVDAKRRLDRKTGDEQIVLAVANYSEHRARGRLVMSDEQGEIGEAGLELAPGETYHGIFSLSEDTGPITIDIDAPPSQDGLKADSRLLLMPPLDTAVTYDIAPTIRDTRALTRALHAADAVPALESKSPDLLVTDSSMAKGAVVTLELASGNGTADGFVGPFVVDRAHPLCRDIDLLGIYWVPAESGPSTRSTAKLISVGEHALYVQSGPNRLYLNLDLTAGNITRSPVWPVLIAGIVDHTRESRPGLGQVNYAGGDALRFNTSATKGCPSRRLKGAHIDLAWPSPHTPPRLPDRPGRYALTQDGATIGIVAVNILAPKESDLTALSSSERAETVGDLRLEASGVERTSTAWMLVLAALLLFGVNWFLTGKEA